MKTYKLICGSSFTFDESDLEVVLSMGPLYLFNGYVGNSNGTLLHNRIMKPPKGFCVDHKDRNPLNNCRNNLRVVTRSENQFNRPQQSNNTTGYKGVTLHRKNQKYVAHIRLYGTLVYLGSFKEAKDAAIAYNKAAIRHVGQCAFLNKVEETESGDNLDKGTI